MFDRIAASYDRANRFLSFGLDLHWRRSLANHVPKSTPLNVLDIATGTGDQIAALIKKKTPILSAVGIDFSENMLHIAKDKFARSSTEELLPERRRFFRRFWRRCTYRRSPIYHIACLDPPLKEWNCGKRCIHFQKANAEALPFDDQAFDLCTFSFGIRNVQHPLSALSEMHRVTKQNGRCLILELSLPRNRLRTFYLLYLRYIVPLIGGWFSKDRSPYRHLNQSIENFVSREKFMSWMQQTGWKDVASFNLFLGIVTLYRGDKKDIHEKGVSVE